MGLSSDSFSSENFIYLKHIPDSWYKAKSAICISFILCPLFIFPRHVFCQDFAADMANSEIEHARSNEVLGNSNLTNICSKPKLKSRLLDKFGFLSVFENSENQPDQKNLPVQSKKYVEYDKSVIRKVVVFTDDTSSHRIFLADYEQAQNRKSVIDYRTQARLRLVKKELLFRPGDVLDPVLIRDSEKRLRKGANLDDAEIIVTPVAGSEEVDVTIIARQKWAFKVGANLRVDKLSGGLEIENFLGLSHSFELDVALKPDLENPLDVDAEYDFHNFLGTGFDLKAEVEFEFEEQTYGFEIEKEFSSTYTRWAGHFKSFWYRERLSVYKPGEDPWLKFNEQDFWLARAFNISKLANKESNIQLVSSVRVFRMQYDKKSVADYESINYPNERFYMASIGLANRNDHVERRVFKFGRTEYLPKGANVSFVGGVEYIDGLKTRLYSGVMANYAASFNQFGYNFLQVSYGGFAGENGYDQISAKLENKYFTKYVKLGKWGFRQFIYATLDLGFNRPEGYEININKSKGIKGFDSNKLTGSKKLVLNLESSFYCNRQILGFKGTGFLFADFAMLGRKNHISSIGKSNLYQGYGFGIRLNQKALGISFIELSFGFYPRTNADDVELYNYMFEDENLKSISSNNLFKPKLVEPEF